MNIIFHLPEISRSKPTLNNIKNYLKTVGETQSESILVIFNADAIKALLLESEISGGWATLKQNNSNVSLLVCHNSMKGFEITPDRMINGVEVIPSAIVEIIKQQKQGALYIRA